MGKKKKLLRFSDTKAFSNVTEPLMDEVFDRKRGVGKTHSLAGNWGKQVFKNNNPIILELGCGKGEYSVGMGKLSPEKKFYWNRYKG